MIRNFPSLKGVKIPGKDENLVISLFADDTTIFLSSKDSIQSLWEILNLRCAASMAKFNEHKTVLLPFGTAIYRDKVLRERRMNDETPATTIPPNLVIVPDSDTCRILGAWIGNMVPYITPWPTVLQKIQNDLERWKTTKPSLEGKCHIINMTIGGRSQYLTRVQGMPKNVETELMELQHMFLWDGKKAKVSHETMILDTNEGGKQILDLLARNEAINLWNLQSYLTQGERRARWCFFVDFILTNFLEKSYLNIRPGQILNSLVQDIHTHPNFIKHCCQMISNQ
jgi:hypothetical protein